MICDFGVFGFDCGWLVDGCWFGCFLRTCCLLFWIGLWFVNRFGLFGLVCGGILLDFVNLGGFSWSKGGLFRQFGGLWICICFLAVRD